MRTCHLCHITDEECDQMFTSCDECHADTTADLHKLALLEADLKDAAGELLVDLPVPGTDMAKVVIANRLLRQENEKMNELTNAARKALELLRGEPDDEYDGIGDEFGHNLAKAQTLLADALAKLER